jgi:hypothetical protein
MVWCFISNVGKEQKNEQQVSIKEQQVFQKGTTGAQKERQLFHSKEQ